MENLNLYCVDFIPRKKSGLKVWTFPSPDVLCFFVDGSADGSSGCAGIGGLLQNYEGVIFCQFYMNMGLHDAGTVEVLAILRASTLVLDNVLLKGRKVCIASDSLAAVSWVNKEGFGNLNLCHLIYDIRSNLESFGNISVIHVPRVFNRLADSLAKKGAAAQTDVIEWTIP